MKRQRSIEEAIQGIGDIRGLLIDNKDYIEIMKYITIVEAANTPGVIEDIEFQKLYKRFYAVRRNREWQSYYFNIFKEYINERNNGVKITFDMIITRLFNGPCGFVETSFSSKMLATINPEKPIYDSNVARALCLRIPSNSDRTKRLDEAKSLYSQLENDYVQFEKTQTYKYAINTFDQVFLNNNISSTKKIDYILWLIGKNLN